MNDEIPKEEARQGRRGVPVLVVLVAALILAAIAWWAAELVVPAPDEPDASQAPPQTEESQTQ